MNPASSSIENGKRERTFLSSIISKPIRLLFYLHDMGCYQEHSWYGRLHTRKNLTVTLYKQLFSIAKDGMDGTAGMVPQVPRDHQVYQDTQETPGLGSIRIIITIYDK